MAFFLGDPTDRERSRKKKTRPKCVVSGEPPFSSRGPSCCGDWPWVGGGWERLHCARFLDPQRPLVSGRQRVDPVFLCMASFHIGELSALSGCTAFPWRSGTWGNKGKGSLCFVLQCGLRCWKESRLGELGRPGLDQLCSGCVTFRWYLSEPQSHQL